MALKYQIFLVFFASFGHFGHSLELNAGAYEDLVITISDDVPVTNCKAILHNLEETLTSASQYLFSALHGRAFLRSASVVLPTLWPDTCAPKTVVSGSGDTPDITVLPNDPTRGRLWTQQSSGCGQPGDQIYVGYETLETKDATLGHSLVKEFAMYRYGVFEEQGYQNDPIYPMCFYDEHGNSKVTGCSDFPITDNGICNGTSTDYNVTNMIDPKARTSIMFAAEAPSVSMFCDDGNHDRFAPTKHNLMCHGRNTFYVILNHNDFRMTPEIQREDITNTVPKVTYKKRTVTRYVLVIENSKDMSERESWSFLRTVIRKWLFVDLPDNTEVGLILTNDTDPIVSKLLPMRRSFKADNTNRDQVSSLLPYTSSESTQAPCLQCAVVKALEMLGQKNSASGSASNVVVLIAPGINNITQMNDVISQAKKQKVKIATINYPSVVRQHRLDTIAERTGGAAYTVTEKKVNVDQSLLTTYFQLSNALYNIIETYYAGNINDIPMEIHRREIKQDGRSSISGSFVVEESMGEPARFMLYTHNSVTPLIKSLQLISPSQQVYTTKSDNLLTQKIITIRSNITEAGTWTYTVEPFSGNPQPHFLQVVATPRSKTAQIVRARFRTHRNQPGGPLVLLCEVKRGEFPILGAKVDVQVTKMESNGSMPLIEVFQLLDTGSGDPDITKNDGIYTRYYNAHHGGPGVYTFEVTVTDNGNTAYTWQGSSNIIENAPCCGSKVPSPKVEIISPFQRVLSPITLEITETEILSTRQVPSGRILDLRAEIFPEDMKARLSWTSPDMGGHNVARYEIKYAFSLFNIVDNIELAGNTWDSDHPYPLGIGSETQFTLDLSKQSQLLGKEMYFVVRAIPPLPSATTVSNWVRVLVPSPPPPPTVPPSYSTNDPSSWPYDNSNTGVDNVRPSMSNSSNFGIQIILPIVIGFILLVVLLVLYFCFCIRRRNRNNQKKSTKANALKSDKMNSNITIVPSTPVNNPQPVQQGYTNQINDNDHHTVGVPVNNYAYDDEPKKRYSLVQQQEQQLIEELKQQQIVVQQREQMNTPNNNYGGLSVISNGTLQRNASALSPYNSWSASQLLHEHERRHSPLENMLQDEQMLTQQQDMINGSQIDHMSLNGQNLDHISLNSHQMGGHIPEHYTTAHIPPPVPPLPEYNSNGYPVNYNIYGVHQPQMVPNPNHAIYLSMQRNEVLVPFNSSLQGSVNSVNSGEKKRRNVTMV